ncbi:MAG: hypothetical protein HY531_03540 [Chloroflexi bacterium]|nr:hypothetical protein [Chloroflexota bacterium]
MVRFTPAQWLIGMMALLLLAFAVACGPAAAPTPTAPSRPATPTTAPVVAAPTATATPAPPAPKRGGKAILAIRVEPTHLSVSQQFGEGPTGIESDRFIGRRPDTSLYPQLAEKWEQIDAKTWRFYFRKNVKFWNGETLTPEGIIADAVWQSTAANAARLGRYVQNLTGKGVDASTVDIICPTACPILPAAMPYLNFQAPAWAKANPDQYKLTTVGLGPYQLVEWKKGEFYRSTRFEGYWGEKPFLDEGMVIFRPEAKVRAAMVGVGEAQIGLDIGIANRQLPPKLLTARLGVESSFIFTNSRTDPLLKDKRVRQAMAYAIDRETITKVLLGGLTKPKHVPFGTPLSVGWTEDPSTKYPYNPEKARQLIKEAGFEGSAYVIRAPSTTTSELDNEIFQAILSYWEAVGLKTKLIPVEAGAAANLVSTPGVGKDPNYSVRFFMTHTNDRFDASGTLTYVDCRAPQSYTDCDNQAWFESKFIAADSVAGAERQKGMEELVIWTLSEARLIALWDWPVLHALSNDIEWVPGTAIQTAPRWSDVYFK